MPRHFGKFALTALITLALVAVAYRWAPLKKLVFGE